MPTIYYYDTKITYHRKDFLCHKGCFIIAHQLVVLQKLVAEAYPWFDHPFDEPMILPNQVIQVFDKIEPAASHGISHPSDEAGFSQALALALLSSIMYKRTWIETSINEMNSVST